MSKVDSQYRPTRDVQPHKPPPRFVPQSPQDFLKAMQQAMRAQKFEGSKLTVADMSKASAEVRQVAAQSYLSVLKTLPGFVNPTLSQPPTANQLRDLLKQLVSAEKQGLLKPESFAQARPDTARKMDASPAGKAWGDFVQAPTNAQAAQNKAIDQAQLLGEELKGAGQETEGAGLRTPQFAGEPFTALSNKQKLTLMTEAFGGDLAGQLKQNGIREPLSFVRAGLTPEARAGLSEQLGVNRGELLVHLARSELMLVGPGRNGEQALRPQHLPALAGSGIVTLAQLGAAKGLSPEQFNGLYAQIRGNFSGFARAVSGERPILKKDLAHWSKSASKKKSSILDSDWEESPRKSGDAEEQIMAWYLQHFAELERKAHHRADAHAKEALKLEMPFMRHDPVRDDGLVCYWIEKPNFDTNRPTFTEMVYVCLDPKTGVIDPRQKE